MVDNDALLFIEVRSIILTNTRVANTRGITNLANRRHSMEHTNGW